MDFIILLLIGIVGGIAVGIQSPLAGLIGQKIGGAASSVIVHLSGLIFSILFLWLRGGERIQKVGSLPWYMFGVGIFGLILYQCITITLPRLGATSMLVMIIIGQIIAGLVLDTFGLLGMVQRPLDVTKIIGLLFLLGGAYLVVK